MTDQVQIEAPAIDPSTVVMTAQDEPQVVLDDAVNDVVQDAPDAADDTPSDTVDPEPEGHQSGFQKRLERAKAKARQEQAAEVEYWKQQALARQEQTSTVPTDKPRVADFPGIEEYTDALTDWKLNQRFQQQEQVGRQQQVQQTYNSRVQEFQKAVPDFQAVMAEFINDYSGVDCPEVITAARDSEYGPAIAYHLAKNPDDMERLIELPPHRRLIELGKIEDRIASKKAVPKEPKVVSTPKPVTPVTGKAQAAQKDPSKMTAQEYIDYRNKTAGRR